MGRIVEITGDELQLFLDQLEGRLVQKLRVSMSEDSVKFKVNEGIWTPPLGNSST